MKLKEIYQSVLNRFKELKETKYDVLLEHIKIVKESHEYYNLESRIAHDCGRHLFPPSERCKWYQKYQCNDTHIKTLFVKALKESGISDML